MARLSSYRVAFLGLIQTFLQADNIATRGVLSFHSITQLVSTAGPSFDFSGSWFALNGFFILFWILTLFAFLSDSALLKKVYLVFLFSVMLAVGLVIGSPVWPFHQWHLWARILPRSVDYFEVWLEDDRGNQFIYDLRAVPPLNPAYLNKTHAPGMFSAAKQGELDEKAQWLLASANKYQPASSVAEWLRFPEREHHHYRCSGLYENVKITPQWPSDHGHFVCLVIKKKRAVFGEGPGCRTEFTLLEEVRTQ